VRAAMALIAATCAGCAGSSLEGSLGTVIDLRFDTVTASQTADAVTVKYLRAQGTGQDVVLQVTASLAGKALSPNVSLDLAEEVATGIQRGTISRNVLNDPRTTFPKLKRGNLQFSSTLAVGQKVHGGFSATFADGTDAASGRTVFGDFGATVQ
jgi:hypothetical protein